VEWPPDIAAGTIQVNVLTSKVGNYRTNAFSFGKLFTIPVDGLVHAQPLDASGLGHNVLIVATMHNSI
jgi:hypothetical protein